MIISDPSTTCPISPFPEYTFFDPASCVFNLCEDTKFSPYLFLEKNNEYELATSKELLSHLKEGIEMPSYQIFEEWTLPFTITLILFYALFRIYYMTLSNEVPTFFSLKERDSSQKKHDLSLFFRGESVILSLISFLSISLFVYCAAEINHSIPNGMTDLSFLLVVFIFSIVAFLSRLLTCFIVGKTSSQPKIFFGYMFSVSEAYHISAICLLILSILLLYVDIISSHQILILGASLIVACFLYRYVKLSFTFLRSNVSVFYLILYLCALEILPICIIMKVIKTNWLV